MKTNVGGMTNKKMNNDVYNLRRKVMGFIYEAKELVKKMPRVTVRITDNDDHRSNVLGCARMGGNIIWIPESTIKNRDDLALRHVVFHEILHAAFEIDHVRNCPLMAPAVSKTTRKTQDILFTRYVNRA